MAVVPVTGINRVNLPNISGYYKSGQATVGWIGDRLFGTVGYSVQSRPASVPSAAQFGVPLGRGGPVTVPVGAVPSARQFGLPLAFKLWVIVPPAPTDASLTAVACQTITLTPADTDDYALVPSVEE